MLRKASIGFALASLVGAVSCKPPEVRACLDFVEALDACTDKNASASGDGEGNEDVCEEVNPACEDFFNCGAASPCVKVAGDFYTLDLSGCSLPEGVTCP